MQIQHLKKMDILIKSGSIHFKISLTVTEIGSLLDICN